jgi:two-component system nitrate/nitrite response regulator NarL
VLPDMPVVVISVMAAEPQVLSAIEAGAKGYILKSESTREITDGIAQVMKGVYPLSPSLARLLFKQLAVEKGKTTQPTDEDFKLTPRELETLRCLSQGLSYEGVADQMGVTLATIQYNVRNLYRKLNVRSQVQAISKARDHDLI